MIRCTHISILILAALLTSCAAPTPIAPAPTPTQAALAVQPGTPAPWVVTGTPSATVSPTRAALPTQMSTVASTLPPTRTAPPAPLATGTARPTSTPTPEPARITLTNNANLRSGPGTVYLIIGGGQAGQVLPVLGQALGWWQTPAGWVAGHLAQANPAAQTVPELRQLPPTPTPLPPTETKPTSTSTSTLPVRQDVVVLGPDTQYPVRARVVKGWGYEFVDASAQYDIVIKRDVFGQVAHDVLGNALYGDRPEGIRYTLLDPVWDTQCPPPHFPRAPMVINTFKGDNYCLGLEEGDGNGGSVWAECARDHEKDMALQECFITFVGHNQFTDDTVLSRLLIAYRPRYADYREVNGVGHATLVTPDYTEPRFALLGRAHKDPTTGQWRWDDPFLELVPAR